MLNLFYARFLADRKSPAEIGWIESKNKRFFKLRVSTQKADDLCFHPMALSVNY
jgi:hypothetical protein